MAWVMMASSVESCFAQRRSDDTLQRAGEGVVDGSDQGLVGSVAGAGVDLARRHGKNVVAADRENCQNGWRGAKLVCVGKAFDDLDLRVATDELDGLTENLGMANCQGAAKLVNLRVAPGADNHFGTNASGVAHGKPQKWSLGFHEGQGEEGVGFREIRFLGQILSCPRILRSGACVATPPNEPRGW